MAKRFIDTDLFRKPFMRGLEAPYKALWLYLLCECDHAGIWGVELDVAQMRMGMKLDPEKALAKLAGAVIEIDGGAKWYIVDFVAFQYGTLNPANKVHASVLAILAKHQINPEEQGATKPLASPLEGAKDKDTVKDKDFTVEKERARGPNPQVQAVIDHLTEALKANDIAPSLDGSEKDNRFAAANLVRKLAKDYPDFDPVDSAKRLIDFATTDAFHGRNSTNVGYLFRNVGKIAADAKAQKTNPKMMTDEQYRNASKAEAERRFGGR